MCQLSEPRSSEPGAAVLVLAELDPFGELIEPVRKFSRSYRLRRLTSQVGGEVWGYLDVCCCCVA